MTKHIVLCADDYGQAPAITEGILDLVCEKKLSAVSCIVNEDSWLPDAKNIAGFAKQIDIGLHFNLTEGTPLSPLYRKIHGNRFLPLPTLIMRTFLRQIDQAAVEAECEAQLKKFVQGSGFLPHFMDGHQHVHQFPVVRKALINVYRKHLSANNSYIRLVAQKIKMLDFFVEVKKIIINTTGTNALNSLLKQYAIPHNRTFTGIYSFGQVPEYTNLFPKFLAEIGHEGLIMCHPGLYSAEMSDPIAKARFSEYQYFKSPQFAVDCGEAGVKITRFWPNLGV